MTEEKITMMGIAEEERPGDRWLTLQEAVREALEEEMRRDDRIFLIGEDIGLYGGVYGCTKGLMQKFGRERVRDTPISEGAIVGAAIGAAATGLRPVAEVMYVDWIAAGGAMEQIVNQLAKLPYIGAGQIKLPIVIRVACGSRYPAVSNGPHHNQSFEAWFMHIPGIWIAVPSTPYDAKGLLKYAIRSDNPVIFFEHKLLYYARHKLIQKLYPTMVSYVPEEEYLIPFGKADIKLEGEDVTVIATMAMVHKVLKAANELKKEGISVELVDPRTLVPLDKETIIKSVKKTGRAVVVSEDWKTAGVTAEIAAMIMEEAFDYLDAPVKRVATREVPLAYSHILEGAALPSEEDIIKAVKEVVG